MRENLDGDEARDSGESIENMMQHLEEAKQREQTATRQTRQSNTTTKLQRQIRQRTDVAVLASNHPSRLEEIAANDPVTHRSGKPWKSAKIGVDAHGRLPIYYRSDGLVTHTGYISRIVLNPSENTTAAEEFVQYISDDDTYGEYHDRLDTTTFIVADGRELAEPFSQAELQKLSGEGTVDEDYSRQPAYVVQRPDDFPDFP